MKTDRINLDEVFRNLTEVLIRGDADATREFLVETLGRFRIELSERRSNYSPEENNWHYVVGVKLRAALDYLSIVDLTSEGEWKEDQKRLEKIWSLMWDCRERLEAYSGGVAGRFFDEIAVFLDEISDFFLESFGHGVYFSPDLRIGLRLCSICNDNIKKCSHLSGRLYDGVPCGEIIRDVRMLSASLVSNPKDPRCRIWPWNMDEEGRTASAMVMSFFRIDDFIVDEKWPKQDPDESQDGSSPGS